MTANNFRRSSGMRFDRRGFLALAAAGTAGTFTLRPRSAGAQTMMGHKRSFGLSKFTEQLPVPGLVRPASEETVELTMQESTHLFHSSLSPARTWGYGGARYLGPTIEARRGVSFTLNASNALEAHPLDYAIDTALHGASELDRTLPRASVHLHGGNTEPTSDGGPEDTFRPGQNYPYFYNNDQEAATLWYHDHALGITRLNVFAGLAGCYFLRDEYDTGGDNPLGLPSGAYEMPLVIQDRSFNPDGSLAYPVDEFLGPWVPEFFGDVAVVNGKAFPNCDVERGLYRFRVINGSNARVYNLYLSNGHSMFQIGGDGGLLNAPVALNRLILAPGERADLLVDFSAFAPGTRIVMKNSAPVPFPDGPRSRRRGGVPSTLR